MAAKFLPELSGGSNIFVDSNIFVYGLNGVSNQCRQFLERCSKEDVTGVTLFEMVNEATHKLMLGEAEAKGYIPRQKYSELRKNVECIPKLNDYWHDTQRILSFNLLFLPTDDSIIRSAQTERESACLFTNDSVIVACMRQYGIYLIASADSDFERASGMTLFRPGDLP